MSDTPQGTYVPDPPTRHVVPEGRADRGTAKRLQLESSPDVRLWMADVLRAHGWICYPPEVTAASQGGPEMVWCEAHGTTHPAGDRCTGAVAPDTVAAQTPSGVEQPGSSVGS